MPVIIVHVLVICYKLMKIIAHVIKKHIYVKPVLCGRPLGMAYNY